MSALDLNSFDGSIEESLVRGTITLETQKIVHFSLVGREKIHSGKSECSFMW